MKTYSFENINRVYVLGDCHGEFKTYFHDIKMGLCVKSEDEDKPHPKEIERLARKAAREQAIQNAANNGIRRYAMFNDAMHPHDMRLNTAVTLSDTAKKLFKKNNICEYSNSVFIIAGDCGIGFNKPKYYEDLFGKFNKILSYNNTYVIFVRGNHDDPEYFDGERINLSNIKAVPDYSIISVKDKNILCVGGAISIDRTWRIKQEERINRFSPTKKKNIYWKNEAPVYNQEALDEIVKETKIDCVVSHSAPSFVNPESHSGIEKWSDEDNTLISDIREERKVLDKVFETLRDNDMKPKYWAYGHFDFNFLEKRSDTIFRGLGDGFNPISIDVDIEQFIYNEEIKKKKGKEGKSAKGAKRIGDEFVNIIPNPVRDEFRIDPIIAEADNQTDIELPDDNDTTDDEFAEFYDNLEENNNGIGAGIPGVEQIQENNDADLPDWGDAAQLGGHTNIDDSQRHANLYDRLRREMEEATARITRHDIIGENVAIAENNNWNYVTPEYYTVQATNANNTVIAGNNGMIVGTLNH